MKAGKREQEILDYLETREGKKETRTQLLVSFAPFVAGFGGKSYGQYSVVVKRLERMANKGLIEFENGGFNGVIVKLKE